MRQANPMPTLVSAVRPPTYEGRSSIRRGSRTLESASLAEFAHQRDLAPQQFGQFLDDGETEPGAVVLAASWRRTGRERCVLRNF